MDTNVRKAKISEIIATQKPVQTGTQIIYRGEIKEFDVYKIPLEFLIYNVKNGRISSLVKSYTVEHKPLEAENEEDSRQIAQFLYNSNEERNKKTLKDIADHGQMEPGIITSDGVIVDGNRRASLLRKLIEDPNTSQMIKDRSAFFLTRVLPEDADDKEILRLETSYQMGTDSKVDYNAIEKYLHVKDMHDNGFSPTQIAEYMGLKNASEVTTYLEIMDLFDAYLETYQYAGIYTRLPRGCEDDFLKLNIALKKIRRGGISWIPQDRIDEVANDLQIICFDYIRLEEKGDFDFRAIASTSNNNFLNDEKTWNEFTKIHFEHTDPVIESDVQDVLAPAQTSNESTRLLNQRDRKWKDAIRDGLMENFKEAKQNIDNKKESNKPLALLRKAKNAIEAIDEQVLHDSTNKSDLKKAIYELTKQLDILTRALQ